MYASGCRVKNFQFDRFDLWVFFCCFKEYVETVKADMAAYEEEARHLAKLGDMHKAQIILTKKKHAEREVHVLSIIFRQVHCLRPKKKKMRV